VRGDHSCAVIKDPAAKANRVHGIKLSRNFGQHAATICGFSSSTDDGVVTLDDDLGQGLDKIPALYAKASPAAGLNRRGVDCVIFEGP